MKFTKLTSAVVASASILGMFASTGSVFAKTVNGSGAANDGNAVDTPANGKAGITFGNDNPTGNTGGLRLVSVPDFDFGSHSFAKADVYNAKGADTNDTTNNQDTGWGKTTGSHTTAWNKVGDTDLDVAADKPYVSVVDQQENYSAAAVTAGATAENGSWTLGVKTDTFKTAATTGTATNEIEGVTMNLKGAKDAMSKAVTKIDTTGDAVDSAAPTAIDKLNDAIAITADGTTPAKVAEASAKNGAGGHLIYWDPANVTLTMPKADVGNGTYYANMTWTLSAKA